MMTLSEAARAMGGTLNGADRSFDSVSIDGRRLCPGALYVALKGARFDGHEFLSQAAQAGAVGAVVEQYQNIDIPQIKVSDSRLALGDLATYWRGKFAGKVVGITGSNGKTTVKELVAKILSQEGRVLATRGNLNNEIGVPLTLLEMRPEHEFAVIEMGANHAGEIAYLTSLVHPDVALITNVAAAHLEGFGSINGIAQAKGEIFGGLGQKGIAVINADDKYEDYWLSLCADRPHRRFSLRDEADVKGEWIPQAGGGLLKLPTPQGSCEVPLQISGEHNARNALAAATVALALGVGVPSITRGLALFKGVAGRLQRVVAKTGIQVIDDTYNANPGSLLVALQVLVREAGEKWLVLGDMAELGGDAAQLHRDMGQKAKALGVERLYCYGNLSRYAAEGFGAGSQFFSDQQTMIGVLLNDLHHGVAVLVKGSRSMHMENVVQALTAEEQEVKSCC